MHTPQFSIERHAHGWAIMAAPGQIGVPLDALSLVSPLFTKDARLCPGIANAIGATFAVPDSGLARAAWEKEITEALESSSVSHEAKWLRGTDTGASSRTMFFHLVAGEQATFGLMMECRAGRSPEAMRDVPHDADDFGRCARLLRRFPQWRVRLPLLAEKLPHTTWPKLVAEWDELTAIHDNGGSVTNTLRRINTP